MRGSSFQIITFFGLTASREEKRIAFAVRKGIPHNHVDLPPLVSIEVTWICIQIGNSEVLLAAVYMSSGHPWDDADNIELLSFRNKSLLAVDQKVKHPFSNSVVSNPSGAILLNLLHINEFEFSAPQYPTP
jgi:hypothetical protein